MTKQHVAGLPEHACGVFSLTGVKMLQATKVDQQVIDHGPSEKKVQLFF